MAWKGDPHALHDDVPSELAGLTEKLSPAAGDWLLIEDGADSDNKKKVDWDNLPSGGGGATDLDDLGDVDASTPATGALFYFDGTNWVPADDGLTTKGDLYVYDGTDFKRLAVGSDDQVLKADSAESLGVKWADESGGGALTFTFSVTGDVSVGSGAARLYPPEDLTIESIRASVGVAPAGASILVDVNKNGSTIFTTQANRPEIAAAGHVSSKETPDVTALTTSDYLTVDVDQVGSSTAGAHLTVIVETS